MKVIIACLLGLTVLSYGQDVDWSSDSDDTSDSAPSYDGIIVQAYLGDEGTPLVALGSDMDDYDEAYCLNFIGLFESDDYDTSLSEDAMFAEVADTRINLAEENCAVSEVDTRVFTIICSELTDNNATLSLTFTFSEDIEGDFGLEYIIELTDYALSVANNSLVMVQSVKECEGLLGLAMESTEVPLRRLQIEGTLEGDDDDDESEETEDESIESADGISDEDSDEFDAGFARFVVSGQALDVCEGEDPVPIGSALVYQSTAQELHIVFDSFECDLAMDPFYGLDGSKYAKVALKDSKVPDSPTTTDKASMMSVVIGLIINAVFIALY